MNKSDEDKSIHTKKNIYTVEAIPIGTKTAKELLKELLTQTVKGR